MNRRLKNCLREFSYQKCRYHRRISPVPLHSMRWNSIAQEVCKNNCHKAVIRRVEAKKLLSRRRQSDYSYFICHFQNISLIPTLQKSKPKRTDKQTFFKRRRVNTSRTHTHIHPTHTLHTPTPTPTPKHPTHTQIDIHTN